MFTKDGGMKREYLGCAIAGRKVVGDMRSVAKSEFLSKNLSVVLSVYYCPFCNVTVNCIKFTKDKACSYTIFLI